MELILEHASKRSKPPIATALIGSKCVSIQSARSVGHWAALNAKPAQALTKRQDLGAKVRQISLDLHSAGLVDYHETAEAGALDTIGVSYSISCYSRRECLSGYTSTHDL